MSFVVHRTSHCGSSGTAVKRWQGLEFVLVLFLWEGLGLYLRVLIQAATGVGIVIGIRMPNLW